MLHRRSLMLTSFLAASTCAIQGCVKVAFTSPIASFQQSVDSSATTLQQYYSSLNRTEREAYLHERAQDPRLEVGLTDPQGKRTPLLTKTFSPESLQARYDAIRLLGLYAKRLSDLAGIDAPTKINDATKLIGAKFAGLGETFSALAGTDATAAKYVGPIGKIAGLLGEMYAEDRRDRALKDALEKGASAVDDVLDQLEQDVATLAPLEPLTIKTQLLDEIAAYNASRTKEDAAARAARLNSIRALAERYDAALASNPAELIQGMREAHHALVKFARSSRAPQDLADLTAALETFSARAAVIAGAAHELHEASKEAGR